MAEKQIEAIEQIKHLTAAASNSHQNYPKDQTLTFIRDPRIN